MASISFEGIVKQYPGNPNKTLDGISLEVGSGEFLVLVGPSGCGKSTLLRTIAGLESISSGQLKIGDRVVNDVPPKDRDIAMVFQSYALYPHMTVRRNMAFGLEVRKVARQDIDAAVNNAAKMLELEPFLEKFPRQLSGGQRQRVAMGRAIVRRPSVFLFDEPLSNLDASLRNQMRVEIKRLHQRLATTMVYVTHDQVEAMTLADRIAVLNKGYLQQVGSPLDLFYSPQNRFVASFIGSPSMHFLDANLQESGGVWRVVLAGGAGAIPIQYPGDWQPQGAQSVVAGLRPQSLSLNPSVSAEGLDATVDIIEILGWEAHLHCQLSSGVTVLAVTSAAEAATLQSGSQVKVFAPPRDIHIFDPHTGKALFVRPIPTQAGV